jgi:hypothetical protein
MTMQLNHLDPEDLELVQSAANDIGSRLARSGCLRLDVETLRAVNRLQGSDFATALLYVWLLQSEIHGPLISDFLLHRNSLLDCNSVESYSVQPRVILVPGAFYEEYPATGGGGELVMHELLELGIPTLRVPIRSVGTLEQNSRILREFLQDQGKQPTLLVSLSKGAADIKWALRDDPSCFQHVKLWVSIGGLLTGTPLINWVSARPPIDWINRLVFYLKGRDYRFFSQLAIAPKGALGFELSLPPSLHAIHVVGFPLRRHAVTRYAKIWHKRFASRGPNDAVLMLEDLLQLPGKVLPIWGVDHYYSPKWDFRMLVHGMLRYWNNLVLEQLGTGTTLS